MSTKRFSPATKLVPVTLIERRIYLIRGHKVMIDTELAQLYGVPTYRLNEAVKRNRKRFPEDFMFQLNKNEAESLTSQFAISKKGRGGAPNTAGQIRIWRCGYAASYRSSKDELNVLRVDSAA